MSKANGKPPKQYDRSAWLKQWNTNIGPLVRFLEKVADGVGEKQSAKHRAVKAHLEKATQDMMKWMGEK